MRISWKALRQVPRAKPEGFESAIEQPVGRPFFREVAAWHPASRLQGWPKNPREDTELHEVRSLHEPTVRFGQQIGVTGTGSRT